VLTIEPDAHVFEGVCDHCGEPMIRVTDFILKDGAPHAICYASCYHHDGQHEVWLDVIFSSAWHENGRDRVTFGCRAGPIPGQTDPGCSLVAGGSAFAEAPLFGEKLTREDALKHPWIDDFWAVVDHVLVHDKVVCAHLYGPDARFDS